jgi:hypothetical protein
MQLNRQGTADYYGGGRGLEWNRGSLGRREAALGGREEDRRRQRWMMDPPAIG